MLCNKFSYGKSPFALMAILSLYLYHCGLAEESRIVPNTPADAFILNRENHNPWDPIDLELNLDLATNLPAGSGRIVSSEFLRSWLASDDKQMNHNGLLIRNAVITNWLNLANMDIRVEVRFENCHFKKGIKLSGAHFSHDLSFQGSVFDGPFIANALQVDGSLLLDGEDMTNLNWNRVLDSRFNADNLNEYLCKKMAVSRPSPEQGSLIFDTNRELIRWVISVSKLITNSAAGTTNWCTNCFEATLLGTNFFIVQTSYEYQATNFPPILRVGPITGPLMIGRGIEPLNLGMICSIVARALSTNLDFSTNDFLMPSVSNGPTMIRWVYEDQDDFVGPVLARWDVGNPTNVTFFRPPRFRGAVSLNGTVIAGKLEAQGAEFLQGMDGTGLKVGGDILISDAWFGSPASFRHAQIGHDFNLQNDIIEGAGASFDCNGLIVGGSLNVEGTMFGGNANFPQVSVGNTFLSSGASFESKTETSFFGLKVTDSAEFDGVQFAGPVNFILAHINGNFDCQDTLFEDTNDFVGLRNITGNASTFNTDFGSMQVDGFAIFDNSYFGRSVSFRNARFENLYLDGVKWPDTSYMVRCYTNNPIMNSLLRVESVDFQSIRDISEDQFDHSPRQLKESESNLVSRLREISPYSFDVYSKLEDYFQREGEPGLADKVFIEAKTREGEEASTIWSYALNRLLWYTVGYGRQPWRAFIESLVCVLGLMICCYFVRKEPKSSEKSGKIRKWCIAFLYSVGVFLPLVDLKVDNLLDLKIEPTWFRYVRAAGRIAGWILVPLWTVAIAGLIK